MSLFGRHRWFVLAAGITLVFAVVSLTMPRGPVLTAIADVGYFLVTLAVGVAMLANAWSTQGINRRFWVLMGSDAFSGPPIWQRGPITKWCARPMYPPSLSWIFSCFSTSFQ